MKVYDRKTDSVGYVKANYGVMTEDKKFYTKDGFNSEYAHACGYVDILEHEGFTLKLYVEHNCYNITVHSRFYLQVARLSIGRYEKGSRGIAKKQFLAFRKLILGFDEFALPTSDGMFQDTKELFKKHQIEGIW